MHWMMALANCWRSDESKLQFSIITAGVTSGTCSSWLRHFKSQRPSCVCYLYNYLGLIQTRVRKHFQTGRERIALYRWQGQFDSKAYPGNHIWRCFLVFGFQRPVLSTCQFDVCTVLNWMHSVSWGEGRFNIFVIWYTHKPVYITFESTC